MFDRFNLAMLGEQGWKFSKLNTTREAWSHPSYVWRSIQVLVKELRHPSINLGIATSTSKASQSGFKYTSAQQQSWPSMDNIAELPKCQHGNKLEKTCGLLHSIH
ncbi:hypothetical protein VNO78_23052 [Psophocarpus tetragonolobus]|uniref:Uncharacterized protein n=1 Tax=Psophocarpus tetragonolobus TaxID=3891 RepID=A0AAN9S463_PSOTE